VHGLEGLGWAYTWLAWAWQVMHKDVLWEMLFIRVCTRAERGLHLPLVNEEMKYKSTRKIFVIEI